jgi:hypothetical protein
MGYNSLDEARTAYSAEKEKSTHLATKAVNLNPSSAGASYRQDTGSISPKSPRPPDMHLGHSPLHGRRQNLVGEDKELKRQKGEGNLTSKDASIPDEPVISKAQSKAFSLPRGQAGGFNRHMSERHNSSPTTPRGAVSEGPDRVRFTDERSSYRAHKGSPRGERWGMEERGVVKGEREEGDRPSEEQVRRYDRGHEDRVVEVQARSWHDGKESWSFKGPAEEKRADNSQQQVSLGDHQLRIVSRHKVMGGRLCFPLHIIRGLMGFPPGLL